MTVLCKLLLWSFLCCLFSTSLQAQQSGENHATRRHPPQDQFLHEILLNVAHARSPRHQLLQRRGLLPNGNQVRWRGPLREAESGREVHICPARKVERNRDNPDGRNHRCAPPPSSFSSSDTVFCLHSEVPHEIRASERQNALSAIRLRDVLRADRRRLPERTWNPTLLLRSALLRISLPKCHSADRKSKSIMTVSAAIQPDRLPGRHHLIA